jgi:glucose/arabinose dehydrogenase
MASDSIEWGEGEVTDGTRYGCSYGHRTVQGMAVSTVTARYKVWLFLRSPHGTSYGCSYGHRTVQGMAVLTVTARYKRGLSLGSPPVATDG